MRTGFPLLLAAAIAAGVAGLAAATHGFRVVTSEGARRLEVARARPMVPALPLTDANGTAFSFADYEGRTLLVEFIYTRCPMICGVLGEAFGDLQERIASAGRTGRLALLSISFDPAHDRPPDLRAYGERFGARPPLWRIAVPAQHDVPRLLAGFGVVVIGDGSGGFIHNAAICVVTPDGRLARILDPAAPSRLLVEAAAVRTR